MVELRRSVRLVIPGDPAASADPVGDNGFGGRPAAAGLARFYELVVGVAGEPDAETGYLVDIKTIDRAVFATLTGPIAAACHARPDADPASVLAPALPVLAGMLTDAGGRLTRVRWRLTPFASVEVTMPAATPKTTESETTDSIAGTALLRQRFDFAAAHRLHVASLSDDENRRLFGKCNNPRGHGHNYRVEPCVAVDTAAAPDRRLSVAELEAIVERVIIKPFDHKHLNEDTEAFGPAGVNPSVENIAQVFHDLLAEAINTSGKAARLVSLTVWETDRTSATYPAAGPGPLDG